MKVVILDAGTLGEDLPLDALCSRYDTTVYKSTSPEEISSRAENADVLILNKLKMNSETLKSSIPKLICVTATGYDNVDLNFCRENNIAVCNVVGYSTNSVAQVTVGMVMQLVLHLNEYTEFVRSGQYSKSGNANRLSPTFYELEGKTWGIVGYGNIGQKVAKIAESFGCKILVNKRTPIKEYECVSLEEICRSSDIITVHTPLTNETNNLISYPEIELMKNTAILVNVARGAVCNEQALTDAVLNNKIGGLGIDVYSKEPIDLSHPFNKIINHSNVCLTPHMAWGAFESRKRCIDEIVLNIEAFKSGETRNRVDLL
ncbi:MAG: hydroxyacid dehydrogenase [Clostridia bacterium]|nr:hydroxyacid dehydrogenase [Clostridia bacterium]